MSAQSAEKASMDETARLLLMTGEATGIVSLARGLRAHHDWVSAGDAMDLWRKYRGMDGRSLPTHDVETGQRFSSGKPEAAS